MHIIKYVTNYKTMTYIIKVNPLKIPKFSNYTTFNEEYEKYARKCKKKAWISPEMFSLEFDTTLEDLRDCIFVRPTEKELKIINKFNVLEII